MAVEPLVIQLPALHRVQAEVAAHPARFKAVVCGRRWGKTYLGVASGFKKSLEQDQRGWWVAPSYSIANEGWLTLTGLARQLPVGLATIRESDRLVRFKGGGSFEVRSGDNPALLVGAGLDWAVLDEAALLKPVAWFQSIRPALADRRGSAMFITTPKSYNWFYDLYEMAGRTKDWARWQSPSWESPYVSAEEIDSLRATMDPGTFEQEIGAMFTAVGNAVFPDIGGTGRDWWLKTEPLGAKYERSGIGVDWGTSERHESCIVLVGLTSAGVVWVRDAWFSAQGSGHELVDVAGRYWGEGGARFARFDGSQASLRDDLRTVGYSDCEKGTRDVDGRIRHLRGLLAQGKLVFNDYSSGVRKLFEQMVQYHRNEEGRIVEEHDDGVDALAYAVSELVTLADNPWSGWEAQKGLSTPTWLSRKVRVSG